MSFLLTSRLTIQSKSITNNNVIHWSLSSIDGDQKVIKSLERILTIWEERGVYSGTLITELRSTLVKEESPPETPAEQKSTFFFCLSLFYCSVCKINRMHPVMLYQLLYAGVLSASFSVT